MEPDRRPSQAVRCVDLLSRDILRGVIFLVAGDKVRILGVVTPLGKNRAESQVLTLIRWALSVSVNGKGGLPLKRGRKGVIG